MLRQMAHQLRINAARILEIPHLSGVASSSHSPKFFEFREFSLLRRRTDRIQSLLARSTIHRDPRHLSSSSIVPQFGTLSVEGFARQVTPMQGKRQLSVFELRFTGNSSCSCVPRWFVVIDVEHREELRDLQKVVNLLRQVQQFQLAAAIADRCKSADQFANPGTVDVIYVP